MKKLHRLVVVLAVVLGIAAPATAHNKIAPFASAFDLRDEIAAQKRVQTVPMFAGTNAFDEVAHVELPPPSIADELARRFATADVQPPNELTIFSRTVRRKLALGPLGVFEENNVNQQSDLGRELHLRLGYVRERWLDPQTGTFLSPDPEGYADSSNLYAAFAGDPVNRRDPTGNRSELSDDRRAIAAKKAVQAAADQRAADAAEMQQANELHRVGLQRMIELRRKGIDVKAKDIVYYTDDWQHGLTGSGQIVVNRDSGRVEDQTAGLVLTVTGLKVASPAISTAYRAGGARAAAPLVADELAGAAIGLNPSLVVNAPRAITNAFGAQRALADLTRQVSAELAANPALARSVLSRAEYEAAVTSGRIAAAQYGNAVERIVAQRIEKDPGLRQVFRHVGGPNNPDFTAFGRNFDITTETKAQVMRHMKRPGYGDELIVVTYQRPPSFTTFPSGQ